MPPALQTELTRDLPETPGDLIFNALGEELFNTLRFRGSLSPLKLSTQILCRSVLKSLVFQEPSVPELPACLTNREGGIKLSIKRLVRAVAFARWRKSNDRFCKEAFRQIIDTEITEEKETTNVADKSTEALTLKERLIALDRMVKNATPLTEALSKIKSLLTTLAERRKKEDRIRLYGQTADALQGLIGLSDLVERQVASLMNKLSKETGLWKKAFYTPAFVHAPEVTKTDVGTDGSLAVYAKAQGTQVSARHVSNASDLRATLLAFLLSFWKFLLKTRGGLSLLLLDDLQELFDYHNRRRIANSIPQIVDGGGRVIITTNDHTFGRRVVTCITEKLGLENLEHRSIHPLNGLRSHIELGPFLEAVEEKRQAFEAPVSMNNHQLARDYLKDLRIYLENRLVDFFDTPHANLPKQPTLSDLIGAIRTRVNAPSDAFTARPFQDLVSDPNLKNGSVFLKLMNESHHGSEDQITFGNVWQIKDACIHVRKLVDTAHEEYERWLRRDPRELVPSKVAIPEPVLISLTCIPLVEDLAAMTPDVPAGELISADEHYSLAWLDHHAIYKLCTHNFGFAAPKDCFVIVDLDESRVSDNSLVVALHRDKVYARRLHRYSRMPSVICLGSEAEDPSKRPPSLILPVEEIRLFQVVGVVFDDRPHYPRPTDEAVLINDPDIFKKVKVAFTIKGESALPLTLPHQKILCGDSLLPNQLTTWIEKPMAITTTEGSAFKRVGKSLPIASHVRQFESVGGLGESLLVRTEELENDPFSRLPLIMCVHPVIGVLYDPS